MFRVKTFILFLLITGICCVPSFAMERNADVFSSMKEKEAFARDVSELIGNAWGKWQKTVRVNGVEVEGSWGLLSPGDLSEPVLRKKLILLDFDSRDKSYEYIKCVKTVANALASGMRAWQRGYHNKGIPFPQGAVSTYTLTECDNIPVTIASGGSSGDKVMTESSLYNYMVYHTSFHSDDIYDVYRAAARGIAVCFANWQRNCSIVGIRASGGIAPRPALMGSGPGPVSGARGRDGKLEGKPFCSELMYETMTGYFREHDKRLQ
jgi:hypothetical protein